MSRARHLSKRFLKLPAQAVPAKLTRVKPPILKWSVEATTLLDEIAKDVNRLGGFVATVDGFQTNPEVNGEMLPQLLTF